MPKYIYFKFNPNNIPQSIFTALENDSTVKLMDIPFANAAIYNDEFALDSTKAEQLKDGNVYGVTTLSNPVVQSLVTTTIIQPQLLDTLVLIPEGDTTLQFEALHQAGYTEAQLSALQSRICILKRPHGFVHYVDTQMGNSLQPVRGMQVWALVFGVPVITYSDNNGYYETPWRFNFGTIMGTLAINSRVNVKPLNTNGTLVAILGQLILNFTVGSLTIKGWVTPCQMANGVNFDYGGYTQSRYWSQILNAYSYHDQYCVASGISKAPNRMTCYAQWADRSDIGNAATPLLGHINYAPAFTEAFLNSLFGGNVNLAQNFPSLFQILTGLLPDNTVCVPSRNEPNFYCSRLAQTEYHELSHASQYIKVGAGWYTELEIAEAFSGSTYGNTTNINWGKVQIAESWAEYLGTEFARQRYGNFGFKRSSFFANAFIQLLPLSQEREEWFSTDWIPCGLYYDLQDNVNTNPISEDGWDRVSGVKIKEMYDAFDPKINNLCEYRENFINKYPSYNATDIRDLFRFYQLNCK